MMFAGCRHMCLSVDGSTHGKYDTLLGVAYSWESDEAAYAPLQRMHTGRVLLDTEAHVSETTRVWILNRRIERLAAYRQMQAVGHMSMQLCGKSLVSYSLPHDVNIAPVQEGQKRVVLRGEDVDTAVMVDVESQRCIRVLPQDLHDVPLLVLVMDQGSVGAAQYGFSKHLRMMLYTRWDELHRIIRDIKQSLTHACGGVFLKAQVFSSFLWCVHSRPFGTGQFHTLLQRGLNIFLYNNPDRHSARFQKYVHQIGRELGMPTSTVEEQDQLHASLSELKTITKQPETAKLGRWFSWNGAAVDNLKEYSAQKMIIEDIGPPIHN